MSSSPSLLWKKKEKKNVIHQSDAFLCKQILVIIITQANTCYHYITHLDSIRHLVCVIDTKPDGHFALFCRSL